ncbi:MAG: type II toxin-antitoxin system VapC family toxin [Deltaproteobacteria bacterium]|nr:type II toxin-antitoxin system VapC family toxin [Deltaproteobacteria bacterium]
MILYLDTSSLLKLYVEEAHSADVAAGVDEAEIVATSVVSYVECLSALARRCRGGDLSRERRDDLVAALAGHWPRYLVLQIDERRAGDLALRDRPENVQVSFSSLDRPLNRAARAEGLNVLAPEGFV